MGLEHQITTRQCKVSSESWPLGAGGLLHHLDENLLTWLQKFRNARRCLLQP